MTDDPNNHTKLSVLEERINGLRTALVLQAGEYERRLTELNHAHAQAAADKNKFLTTELFYSNKEAVAKWQNEMDQWRAKVIGIAIGAGLVAGLVGGSFAGLLSKLFQ